MMRLSFALILLMLIFVSCEKDENIGNIYNSQNGLKDVTLVNGTLVFKTGESYIETYKKMINMTEEELDNWEMQLGFISNRMRTNIANEKLLNAKSEDEVYEILTEYSDCIKLIGEGDNREIMPIIESKFYSTIANQSAIFQVGNEVTKVAGDYIITADLKNISKLDGIDLDNAENINDSELKLEKYIERHNLKSTCGTNTEGTCTANASGCRNDRRVKIKFEIYKYHFQDYYTFTSEVKVWGQTRLSILCLWVNYKTGLDLMGANYIAKFPALHHNEFLYWVERDIECPRIHKDNAKDITHTLEANITTHINLPMPYFVSLKGTATSDGVGHRYVTVSCPNN